MSKFYNKVDLIITNPPYISSVRYAETLKLELYWMEICKNQNEFMNLAKSMTGSDYFKVNEIKNKCYTKYNEINTYIDQLYDIDKKQSYVVAQYFNSMEKVIINMNKILKVNKKMVIKIGNSKIRNIIIPTGKLLTVIAEKNGFQLKNLFNDKINPNSRSLTIARNYYSDIILEDNIVILEKVNEI